MGRPSPNHAGIKPARHGKNIVHRKIHSPLHRLAKGGHLCALEHNSADIRVVRNKSLGCVDHFGLDGVEAVGALHAYQSLQVASCWRAADYAASGILFGNSEALEVQGSQLFGVIGDDTDLLVWCKPGEDGRDLEER